MRIVILAATLLAATITHVRAETVMTLTPRPGATVKVLVDKPAAPIGSVVLFAGGDGVLNLDDSGRIGGDLKENHLVRTRADYVSAGYAVFVPDIASDQKGTRGYRFSDNYARDVAAVIAAARAVGKPVAIVGTSRGALPVMAAFAKQRAQRPDVAVISSGVLIGNDGGAGSATTLGDAGTINVPVLLLRHRLDSCRATPPGDADKFKAMLTAAPKVDIVTIEGGGPRGSGADPCGASHYHGFYGVDDRAVSATVQWLKENMK